MNPPIIFLIGPPQHGKTTARHIVEKLTGLSGASCSDVIAAFLAERRGTTYEAIRALPKEESRPAFIEAGDWLCGMGELKEAAVDTTVDGQMFRSPSAIVRTLVMAGVKVIDGVRRKLELEEARDRLAWIGLRSLTIWIERTNGPKIKDTTTVVKEQAEESILNDGTEADLAEGLHQILLKYFPPAKPKEPVILGATANAPLSGAILDSSGNVAGSEPKGIIKPFSAL